MAQRVQRAAKMAPAETGAFQDGTHAANPDPVMKQVEETVAKMAPVEEEFRQNVETPAEVAVGQNDPQATPDPDPVMQQAEPWPSA